MFNIQNHGNDLRFIGMGQKSHLLSDLVELNIQ